MTREITITPVLNGFVCKVGCQKVVFESISEMVRNLEAYYKNPDATEKKFIAEAVNKMPDGPDGPVAEACDCAAPTPMRESLGESLNRTPVVRESRR